MTKLFWKSLLTAPALLGAVAFGSVAVAETAPAMTQVREYSNPAANTTATPAMTQVREYSDNNSIGVVTSVSQLGDVQPTDWAFQALQSLVERYGCIAGYPDGTYKGSRALSRYEFAAGLNACMDRVNELIAAGTADLVTKQDLEALKALQEQFKAELEVLRGEVDGLTARVDTLEAQQFSTTTKLSGEVLFLVAGLVDGDDDTSAVNALNGTPGARVNNNTAGENITFSSRVRLAFDTSFTGKDRLRTRLQFRNIVTGEAASTGTNMTRLGTAGDTAGNIQLDDLTYRFPALGGRITIAAQSQFDRIYDTVVPFESSGSGALSRFGRYNPIYRSTTGAGGVIDLNLSPQFGFTAGYLAGSVTNAATPTVDNGLLGGQYTALGQLTWKPSSDFKFALLYARSFYPEGRVAITGGTGSNRAGNPFGAAAGGINDATTTDDYSAQFAWNLNKTITIGGWFGYEYAAANNGRSADIINWAAQLGFKDLINDGDMAGIIFGMPPQRTGGRNPLVAGFGPEGNTTSYHIEAFYRYQLTDNIQITPGLIVITSPEHNSNNDTQYVGVIRTRFAF